MTISSEDITIIGKITHELIKTPYGLLRTCRSSSIKDRKTGLDNIISLELASVILSDQAESGSLLKVLGITTAMELQMSMAESGFRPPTPHPELIRTAAKAIRQLWHFTKTRLAHCPSIDYHFLHKHLPPPFLLQTRPFAFIFNSTPLLLDNTVDALRYPGKEKMPAPGVKEPSNMVPSIVTRPATGTRTVTWNDIPEWRRDNRYILSGYRYGKADYLEIVASLTFLHNETCNVYSHLAGALLLPLVATVDFRILSAPQYIGVSKNRLYYV